MSTPKFYTVTIADVRAETDDTVSVAFAIPADLQQDYQYQSGQYITCKQIIAGEEVRRSYSLCSAPQDGEWRVAVKQVPNGVFSTYVNQQLKIGDTIDIMTPMGHFVPTDTDASSAINYFGFASGSGITPVLSILKTVLHAQPNSTFTLIYGNKNVASIIFKEQIEALKNIFMHRLQILHVLSREKMDVDLNYGRINTEKCEQLFSSVFDIAKVDEAFICGPEEMTMQVKDFLITKGVPAKHVKFELFGTAITAKNKLENNKEVAPTGPISKVSIKVDERTFVIDLAYDGENILDAALRNGADLPFACKGGVCCTCRAKITSGAVKMNVNYALEKDEVEQGFVLSCQAHPTTPEVTIDFDVR